MDHVRWPSCAERTCAGIAACGCRRPAQRGFGERISTAMTLAGGVAGIGFDVSGLGDGCGSVISINKCNDEGDDQRKDLDSEEDDRCADSLSGGLEDDLVLPARVDSMAK
jgi:hypothetical protein